MANDIVDGQTSAGTAPGDKNADPEALAIPGDGETPYGTEVTESATGAPNVQNVIPSAAALDPLNNVEQVLKAGGWNPAQTSAASGASASTQQIIDYARSWLGTPYEWGGTTRSGVDCSGFVQAVMNKFGYNLPRISYQQANSGQRIALDQLKPGDLVAWNNSTRNPGADHIALYIGGGKVIEAPRPGLSVMVSPITDQDQAWGVRLPQPGAKSQ